MVSFEIHSAFTMIRLSLLIPIKNLIIGAKMDSCYCTPILSNRENRRPQYNQQIRVIAAELFLLPLQLPVLHRALHYRCGITEQYQALQKTP